jgi:hypothetical protein
MRISPRTTDTNDLPLIPHEHDKHGSDPEARGCEHDVHGCGVAVEGFESEGVDAVLREVDEAGETDDGAVDLAEGFEAEDFGCVVPTSSSINIRRAKK